MEKSQSPYPTLCPAGSQHTCWSGWRTLFPGPSTFLHVPRPVSISPTPFPLAAASSWPASTLEMGPPFGVNTASGLSFSASLCTHGGFVSLLLHTTRTSPKAFCSPRQTLSLCPMTHPGDTLIPSDTWDTATPWPPCKPPVPSLLDLLLGCIPGLLPQPLLLPFTVVIVWASVLGLPLSPSSRPSPVNHNQLTLFPACSLS